jgi:exodeoxyribonuclease III
VLIATWNINSLTSRLEHVLGWCTKNRPDVLCLQETKCVDQKFPEAALRSVGFNDLAYIGESAYNGVAILSRRPLKNVQLNFPDDPPDAAKRFIAATIDGVRIVNVYAPHGTKLGSDKYRFKLEWLARLRKYFDENYDPHSDPVILCGDINVAPHESDVWKVSAWRHKLHFTKPERDAIREVKRWGFVDVYRHINLEAQEFTWWSYYRNDFEKDRGLRIDHIWASPAIAESCVDAWIDREPRALPKPSDHAPVVAAFEI